MSDDRLFKKSSIGTTKKGIGPAYSGKASRSGLRVHHLFDQDNFGRKFRKLVEGRFKRYGHFEYDTEGEIQRYKVTLNFPPNCYFPTVVYQVLAERLKPYVIDSVVYIHEAITSGKRVLVEGANALMLDLDFGTYPYVTSSSTTIGGVCTGLGIPPKMIGKVIGVLKAYTTRVGGGPFPSEQLNVSSLYIARTFYINTFAFKGYWNPSPGSREGIWHYNRAPKTLRLARSRCPKAFVSYQWIRHIQPH